MYEDKEEDIESSFCEDPIYREYLERTAILQSFAALSAKMARPYISLQWALDCLRDLALIFGTTLQDELFVPKKTNGFVLFDENQTDALGNIKSINVNPSVREVWIEGLDRLSEHLLEICLSFEKLERQIWRSPLDLNLQGCCSQIRDILSLERKRELETQLWYLNAEKSILESTNKTLRKKLKSLQKRLYSRKSPTR
jgi:hypothetical protein